MRYDVSTRDAIELLRAYDDNPDGKLDVGEFSRLVADLNTRVGPTMPPMVSHHPWSPHHPRTPTTPYDGPRGRSPSFEAAARDAEERARLDGEWGRRFEEARARRARESAERERREAETEKRLEAESRRAARVATPDRREAEAREAWEAEAAAREAREVEERAKRAAEEAKWHRTVTIAKYQTPRAIAGSRRRRPRRDGPPRARLLPR